MLDLPTEQLARLFTQVPDQGLGIIAPIGILMMLVTLALALLNKAAPTFNLFRRGNVHPDRFWIVLHVSAVAGHSGSAEKLPVSGAK